MPLPLTFAYNIGFYMGAATAIVLLLVVLALAVLALVAVCSRVLVVTRAMKSTRRGTSD